MVQVLTSLTGLTHLALRGKKITAMVIKCAAAGGRASNLKVINLADQGLDYFR